MKRITRTTRAGTNVGERVWLDASGHWTRDVAQAFAFEDDEASKRVRRIPHAEVESIENKSTESSNV
jgi:hypothetical protein